MRVELCAECERSDVAVSSDVMCLQEKSHLTARAEDANRLMRGPVGLVRQDARVSTVAPSAIDWAPTPWALLANDDVTHREPHERGCIAPIELFHEMLPMALDRIEADRKDLRDLRIRRPFGDELQHLALPGR